MDMQNTNRCWKKKHRKTKMKCDNVFMFYKLNCQTTNLPN